MNEVQIREAVEKMASVARAECPEPPQAFFDLLAQALVDLHDIANHVRKKGKD